MNGLLTKEAVLTLLGGNAASELAEVLLMASVEPEASARLTMFAAHIRHEDGKQAGHKLNRESRKAWNKKRRLAAICELVSLGTDHEQH